MLGCRVGFRKDVRKPGTELAREALLAFFDGRIAKWRMPADVVFVGAIPLGATGKMLKNELREQFGLESGT